MKQPWLVAFVGVVIGLQAGTAVALNPDNGPGCGLGKLAWSDYKTPKNIAPQVMMATTNGTFGSQTFGISFGTSGCTNDGKVMASQETNTFIASTFDTLSTDMARGGGEHLTALATLMNVPIEQQPEFFQLAQQQYLSLTEAGEVSSVAVVKALQNAMTGHPALARLAGSR